MRTVPTTDGLDLTVDVRGPDHGPTVLLVHGWPDTGAVWDELVFRLEPRVRVARYDVRGTGASDAPRGRSGYRIEQLARDVVSVADAVSPDEPVHLVGHDWGAITGFEVACDPELAARVASFTCISGASFDHAGRLLRRAARPSTELPRHVTEAVRQLVRSWYVLSFQVPGLPEAMFRAGIGRRIVELVGPEAEPRLGHPAPTFLEDAINGVGQYRANLRRVLRPVRDHVHVPTQVIIGDRDPVLSEALFEELPELAPAAWLRVLEGGHWLPRTHADVLVEAIDDLVAETTGGTPSPGFARARLDRHDRRPWHGRLAVVTGAGNGIGRATALAAAERGADLVLADLDADALDRVATFARHHDVEVGTHVVDVADGGAMESFAKQVLAERGVPDLVVNNAGIGMAGPFLETSTEDWERILGVNLWGVVHGARLFAGAMVEAGIPGAVVNVSSGLAFLPGSQLSAYATTKAAVLMLSEVLRNEFAEHGITVHAICPGVVDTGITDRTAFVGVGEEEAGRRRARTSDLYQLRSLGPEAVADAVVAAVEHDRAIVPVGIETHLGRLLGRISPGLVRRLGATDLVSG